MSADELIETLEARPGKNPGEAIASYGRCIVFLPKGSPTSGKVRVRLIPIEGKTDSRGWTMYRSRPAPDEYTERWINNEDGTASRVTIETNWLLQESEVGVIETRKLESRDGTPRTQSNFQVVWGSDLDSSVLEDHQVSLVPEEEEKVQSGRIVWQKVGEREEPGEVLQYNLTEIFPLPIHVRHSEWGRNCLSVNYDPDWNTALRLSYHNNRTLVVSEKWGDLPAWLQTELALRYPVCSCGRQRRDSQISDGYAKCELCRAEEICERCGKQTTVKNLSGRLVCVDCEVYEAAEQLIAQMLTSEHHEAIAGEAKKLASAQALEQEAGEAILRATLDHLESDWNREDILDEQTGYGWYYFAEDGIYGTKLAPAALAILEFLPQATGNGLVEMVAWLALGPRSDSSSDYYTRTQVQGESVGLPPLEDTVQKLVAGELGLADRLRGSEADRKEALAGYQRLAEKLGEDDSRVEEVAKVLQAKEQDYVAALAIIRKVEEAEATRQARAEAGEIWLDVFVPISHRSRTYTGIWAVGSDGSFIEATPREVGSSRKRRVVGYDYGDLPTDVLVLSHSHDDYGYQLNEAWEVHYLPQNLTPEQRETAARLEDESRYYFEGPGTGWDLTKVGKVSFHTEYARSDRLVSPPEDHERMISNLPIDVSMWDVTSTEDDYGEVCERSFTVWAREKLSPRGQELLAQIRDLRDELSWIEEERNRGGRVEITFKLGKKPNGEPQLEAKGIFTGEVSNKRSPDGSGYSSYESQQVLFVSRTHCPWLDDDYQPQAGQTWICTTAFQIAMRGGNVPIIVVNPQVCSDHESEIWEKLACLERELAAEREANLVADPFDEEGNPQTAMAAAFAEALGNKD